MTQGSLAHSECSCPGVQQLDMDFDVAISLLCDLEEVILLCGLTFPLWKTTTGSWTRLEMAYGLFFPSLGPMQASPVRADQLFLCESQNLRSR